MQMLSKPVSTATQTALNAKAKIPQIYLVILLNPWIAIRVSATGTILSNYGQQLTANITINKSATGTYGISLDHSQILRVLITCILLRVKKLSGIPAYATYGSGRTSTCKQFYFRYSWNAGR
jgi:hypothetical protein